MTLLQETKAGQSMDFPVGTSFAEYKGDMYVTHPEHGVRKVIVGKDGEIDLETVPCPPLRDE